MKTLRQMLKKLKTAEIKKILSDNHYYISPLGLIMSKEGDEYCLGEVGERYSRWGNNGVLVSTHIPDNAPSYQFETERDVLMSVLKNYDIPFKALD
jgi:hypothetical protein